MLNLMNLQDLNIVLENDEITTNVETLEVKDVEVSVESFGSTPPSANKPIGSETDGDDDVSTKNNNPSAFRIKSSEAGAKTIDVYMGADFWSNHPKKTMSKFLAIMKIVSQQDFVRITISPLLGFYTYDGFAIIDAILNTAATVEVNLVEIHDILNLLILLAADIPNVPPVGSCRLTGGEQWAIGTVADMQVSKNIIDKLVNRSWGYLTTIGFCTEEEAAKVLNKNKILSIVGSEFTDRIKQSTGKLKQLIYS